MAKGKRTPEQAPGTVFEHGTKSRWIPPDVGIRRGKLTRGEETLLATSLNPEKPITQDQAELGTRAARADTTITPEDRRPVPPKLHEHDEVDALGAPQLTEAFLRYVSHESATSERDRRLNLILAELEHSHRVLWAVLAERYLYNRTQEEIAAELFLSQQTVSRMLLAGTAWVHMRFRELYSEGN